MDTIKILKEVNYRDDKPLEIWYFRDTYIQEIKKYLWNRLIKVLIWQRRAGKSYIMRQILHFMIHDLKIKKKNILYLNFENKNLDFIKSHKDLSRVIDIYIKDIKPHWKVYFLFDEIQDIAWWEKVINSYKSNTIIDCEIFITWSNSTLLSGELATYLSWRYITKEIYPYSYHEYLGLTHQKRGMESFSTFINFSWIPELYNLPDKELQISFLESLKDTVIMKDIVKRYSIKDVDFLEKLFLFLADNIWWMTSLNNLVKKLKSMWIKTNTTTLWNYIKYIEHTFFMYGISRYDLRWKKILEWEKKYYCNDLWIKNLLLPSFDRFVSKQLENYVANTLRQKWYKIYVWEMPGMEVDFVAQKWNEIKYYQVSYSLSSEEVAKREYKSLEQINDNREKIIISMDTLTEPVIKGIRHIKAREL